MDVLKAIKARRSIRLFKDNPVDDELIEKILEAGIWAPSAGNLQAWVFIVVRNKRIKEALSEAALGQPWVRDAPVIIVACADRLRSSTRYGERGWELYSVQDATLAVGNMMLAATALGLGTVFIGAFNENAVQKILRLPRHLRPICLLPVGWPAEAPNPPPRRPLSKVVFREIYGGETW